MNNVMVLENIFSEKKKEIKDTVLLKKVKFNFMTLFMIIKLVQTKKYNLEKLK